MYRYCPGTCGCACQSPTMLLVGNCRANTTEKVRSDQYDDFDLRKLTAPSNPVASGLRAWWTDPHNFTHVPRFAPHGCCVELITSIRTRQTKRMRHASKPGRWSHNETDRGGATAPRKASKPSVRFVRAAIPRAMTWSGISSICEFVGMQ